MTYTYPLYNPYTYLTILTIHLFLLYAYVYNTCMPFPCEKQHCCNRDANTDVTENDKGYMNIDMIDGRKHINIDVTGIYWDMNIDVVGGGMRMNIEPYGGSALLLPGSHPCSEVVLLIPTGSDNNSFLSVYDKKAVSLSVLPKKQIFRDLNISRLYFYLT